MSGRQATPGELANSGFGQGGIQKGSVAANMMSSHDRSGGSRGAVPDLQSAGARGVPYTGSSGQALNNSGFSSGGVRGNSVGASVQSQADRGGSGKGMVSSLQSHGARQ